MRAEGIFRSTTYSDCDSYYVISNFSRVSFTHPGRSLRRISTLVSIVQLSTCPGHQWEKAFSGASHGQWPACLTLSLWTVFVGMDSFAV